MRLMGIVSWTLRGIVNGSRSLLLAAARDLIKVLRPFPLQQLIVEVLGGKAALLGA